MFEVLPFAASLSGYDDRSASYNEFYVRKLRQILLYSHSGSTSLIKRSTDAWGCYWRLRDSRERVNDVGQILHFCQLRIEFSPMTTTATTEYLPNMASDLQHVL